MDHDLWGWDSRTLLSEAFKTIARALSELSLDLFVGTEALSRLGLFHVTTSAVVSIIENPGDFLIAVSSSLTASTTAFFL